MVNQAQLSGNGLDKDIRNLITYHLSVSLKKEYKKNKNNRYFYLK